MVKRLWDGRLLLAVRQCCGRFAGHRQGTIAILYALLAIPTLGIVFGGVDYSRALSVQTQFQSAAEAAAGVAAKRLYEGPSAAQSAFRAAFRSNLPDDLKDHPYDLDIAGDGSSVSVRVTAGVPTTMIAILGVTRLDVAAAATAKPPLTRLPARGNERLPSEKDIEQARRQMQRALRKMGHAGLPNRSKDLPSADELERQQRKIQRELKRLRF